MGPARAPEYTGLTEISSGDLWPCSAYILEDGEIAAHGLGDTEEEAQGEALRWFALEGPLSVQESQGRLLKCGPAARREDEQGAA